jgi:L-histidine N-alpha-methyltransferase
MTTQVLLPIEDDVLEQVAEAVRRGLAARPKSLPPWLFYDEAGSRLFEQITELPEYYLTRTERSILAADAPVIVSRAAGGSPLRIVELGAGSAAKTRLLLLAALQRQHSVVYEPVDVSASALETARERIEREFPTVRVIPRVIDYTREFELGPAASGERTLVVYIGSSIGNFEPAEAERLLVRVRARLSPRDSILLGVDLTRDEQALLDAYNDEAQVTAAFNLNLLTRLNRELGAGFNLDCFQHRAIWNPEASRIEMHLESRVSQTISIPAIDLDVHFARGETIHTENSYKFSRGGAEDLLLASGFIPTATFIDRRNRFAVCLAHVD